MKLTNIAAITAVVFLPLVALAQTPPIPPVPPVPAVPPVPPPGGPHGGDRERAPKVPVTYLGVETSSVPNVVSEQLGLAKGFGLVVDYVVPDGPAAAAGVQANDILKMFNDQILMEPNQLAKLVRSNADGATATLTVLRKGAETKLTVKLAKREVPQRRGWDGGDWKHGQGMGAVDLHDMGEELKTMQDRMGGMQFSFNDDTKQQISEQAREAREMAREAARAGAQAGREGMRQAREAIRQARQMQFTQRDNGAIRTTRIDMGKAQIVLHDAQGELKVESVDGKKVLTAKDPEGRLIFSGPVGTKEELDKAPAEVRQRYEKLEQKDLPNAVPPNVAARSDEDTADAAADAAADADDGDVDEDNDNDDAPAASTLQDVSVEEVKSVPYRRLGNNNIIII